MTFAKDQRKRRFEPGRSTFALRRAAPVAVFRIAALAVLAILGAAFGLARHFTHALPPMRVPVQPSPTPTYDADAGELPAPELEPADAR